MFATAPTLAPRGWTHAPPRRRIVHQKVHSNPRRQSSIVARSGADGEGDAAKDDGPPQARENVDWREFRARLVASESAGDDVTPGGMKKGLTPQAWAHALTRPERGALLMAMDGEPGWWRHVVILILGE